LYAEDLAAAEWFYRDAVGLQVIGRGDLAVVFRCGDGVLLIFDPRKSRAAGREVPSHGAASAGHIAFTSKPEDLGAWRKQLHEAGVSIEQERIGKKVAVPSTFAIQPVMLSNWLLQHYGVVVGSLSEVGKLFVTTLGTFIVCLSTSPPYKPLHRLSALNSF